MSYLPDTLSEVKPHKAGTTTVLSPAKSRAISLRGGLTLTEEAAQALVKRAHELNLLPADGEFKLPVFNQHPYDTTPFSGSDYWMDAARSGKVFGVSASDSSQHYLLSDTNHFCIDDGLNKPIIKNNVIDSDECKEMMSIRCTIPDCGTTSFEASNYLAAHLRAGKDAYLRFHPTGIVQWISPNGKEVFDAYAAYVAKYNEEVTWWQNLLDTVSTADAIEQARAQMNKYAKMPMAWHVSTGKTQHLIATNGADNEDARWQAGAPLCTALEFGADRLDYEIECNGLVIERIPYLVTCDACAQHALKLMGDKGGEWSGEVGDGVELSCFPNEVNPLDK